MSTAAAMIRARMRDLYRRTCLRRLAQLAAAYQPTSQDDASARRAAIVALFDREIHVAADQGEDDVFSALSDLRDAVARDLTARGASLAPVRTFELPSSLPADVVANRLYRNPARADELVRETRAPHPLFMPRSFAALAS